MKQYLTILATTLLIGCVSMASNLNKVSVGMTKEEVIKSLGNPTRTEAKNDKEYLIYYFGDNFDDFYDGTEHEYSVILQDGKVKEYLKTRQTEKPQQVIVKQSAPPYQYKDPLEQQMKTMRENTIGPKIQCTSSSIGNTVRTNCY